MCCVCRLAYKKFESNLAIKAMRLLNNKKVYAYNLMAEKHKDSTLLLTVPDKIQIPATHDEVKLESESRNCLPANHSPNKLLIVCAKSVL